MFDKSFTDIKEKCQKKNKSRKKQIIINDDKKLNDKKLNDKILDNKKLDDKKLDDKKLDDKKLDDKKLDDKKLEEDIKENKNQDNNREENNNQDDNKEENKINSIKKVIQYLNENLNTIDLENLSNMTSTLNNKLKGDGAGLSSGFLIDLLICEFFSKKLSEYKECHEKECDMKICSISFSQKKITGKSVIALDWSKNPDTSKKKETFQVHILLINLVSGKWWKNNPKNREENENINYTEDIDAGLYFIDKDFCKKNIKLSSNNKTNTLIEQTEVYKMLLYSKNSNLFIKLPKPTKTLDYSLINGFSNLQI